MPKPILLAIVLSVCTLAVGASHAAEEEPPSQLCVVWSSGDPGVADVLRSLDIDVKPMGVPLSDRLKGPWKVLTF
jgi:hypothetical protein